MGEKSLYFARHGFKRDNQSHTDIYCQTESRCRKLGVHILAFKEFKIIATVVTWS